MSGTRDGGGAIRIAPARADQVPAIRACAEAAYAVYVPRIGREPAPMTADFAALVADGQVSVLTEGGDLRGFAVFHRRGDHVHLENLAVDPAHHGRRFGARLIGHVEAEARRMGLSAVELYTNEKMFENLLLYPKLGYREVGRRREDGFDRVYFRKPLDAESGRP